MSLTRIGPSRRATNSIGTFAAVSLRPGSTLHCISRPTCPQAHPTTTVDKRTLKQPRGSYLQPFAVNLARLPPKKISLLHFLMLRHQWASSKFFFAATDEGFFLTVPRSFAPSWICDAADGPLINLQNNLVTMRQKEGRASDELPPAEKVIWDDVIDEDHMFHINDAFPWQLPPAEDLACPKYWAEFRGQLRDYLQLPGAPIGEENEGNPSRGELTESNKEVNVKISIDWVTGRPKVITLRRIHEGEEILAHYGIEWWSQHLLSKLFVAASDDEIRHIRWIEALFQTERSQPSPFPVLRPCTLRNENVPRLDLGDVTTRKKASSEAVLVSSIRRSCQDSEFLRLLLSEVFLCDGTTGSSSRGVLDEVSVKELRALLLRVMTGKATAPDDGSIEV